MLQAKIISRTPTTSIQPASNRSETFSRQIGTLILTLFPRRESPTQQLNFSQSNAMCLIARVKNRCGHINDHVQMRCHNGKPVEGQWVIMQDQTNRATRGNAGSTYLDDSKVLLYNLSTAATRTG